jgi:hypothetical protein
MSIVVLRLPFSAAPGTDQPPEIVVTHPSCFPAYTCWNKTFIPALH